MICFCFFCFVFHFNVHLQGTILVIPEEQSPNLLDKPVPKVSGTTAGPISVIPEEQSANLLDKPVPEDSGTTAGPSNVRKLTKKKQMRNHYKAFFYRLAVDHLRRIF